MDELAPERHNQSQECMRSNNWANPDCDQRPLGVEYTGGNRPHCIICITGHHLNETGTPLPDRSATLTCKDYQVSYYNSV